MISFVYFDLGGVVIRDFSGTDKWTELKRSLKIEPKKDKEFDEWFEMVETEVNRGGRTIDSLLPEMKSEFGAHIPRNYSLLNDGFVKNFEKNESIWKLISAVSEKYRIGLLTNMYPGMLDAIKKAGIMPPNTWEIVIDSSKIGAAKPERVIFEIAREKAMVENSNIFFIDNTKNHIDAALDFGWQTYLYEPLNPLGSNKALETILVKA